MELLNSNDELVLVTNETSQIKDYFRFDGDQIGKASFASSASTTAIIDDSANTESLTEVSDLGTLNYLFSKVRVIRTSNSGDIIRIKELQLFIDGENKASNTKSGLSYINTAGESTSPNDITQINDNNVLSSDTNFQSTSTSIGVNTGINFGSYYSKYDIEAIVYYNAQVNGNDAIGLRIELLNTDDNIRFASSQVSSGVLYYRMDGDRIGDATLSSSASTIAVIDDSSNTESLTGL
jgi:hypothetical protein